MTNKSLVYMLVAVMVGYMLVSAVPDQIVMYTTPPQSLSMESGEESVEMKLYSDSVNDSEIEDINNITLTGEGFGLSGDMVNITEADELGQVADLDVQVDDLEDQLLNVSEEFEDVRGGIAEVASVAEEAVAAAEAATEAVEAVASTANQASQAAADAAEAAKESASGLTTLVMASWWVFDILVAVIVYWFAKQRFS